MTVLITQYDRSVPIYYVRKELTTGEQEWYWKSVLIYTSVNTNSISYKGDTYTLGTYKTTEYSDINATAQYNREGPAYYIRRDPTAAEQKWYWNNVLIATTAITDTISYNGDTYTLGTYRSKSSGGVDQQSGDRIIYQYYEIVGPDATVGAGTLTYEYYEITGPDSAGVTDDTSTTAIFQTGSGGVPTDILLPEGEYIVYVDKVVKIQNLESPVRAIEDNGGPPRPTQGVEDRKSVV